MADINADFEKEHLKRIRLYQQQVEAEYFATIERIVQASIGLPAAETFRIAAYPSLEALIDRELTNFRDRIEGIVVNGINAQWELSQTKFGAIVSDKYGPVSPPVLAQVINPQQKALEAFKTRKKAGLKLSDRVWNYTNQFRNEIEQALFVGIEKGTPAKQLASQMKSYLKEPDKLFRRVRDAKGELQLSKAAKEYHPGQGVYRSSYKNALRLTRTEVNSAYRNADIARWQSVPFVIGYRTMLSNRHPKYDVCDVMAEQVFPKDFQWSGWHAQCLCYLQSIMASKQEFEAYENALLAGKSYKFKSVVKEMPEAFTEYVAENADTFKGWKRLPNFLTDNPKLAKAL